MTKHKSHEKHKSHRKKHGNMKVLNIFVSLLILAIPMACGYITSSTCNVKKESGENVAFRPPALAFEIIWPILFFLFGLSWVFARLKQELASLFYASATILLCIWIWAYSCEDDKKAGVWVLIGVFANLLMCYSFGTITSKVLLSPLIAWSLFATFLNTTEVTLENSAHPSGPNFANIGVMQDVNA